ncbi:MAG TPA: hypothetical protein VHS06_02780, partial [Chloroflexota bacterium]|nr:hypothetical protein [Chloroflexota bacterium]
MRRARSQPPQSLPSLRRVRNRYNGDVNGNFLCDRGRFGYEYVNSERRIREPLVRGGSTETTETEEAVTVRGAPQTAREGVP